MSSIQLLISLTWATPAAAIDAQPTAAALAEVPAPAGDIDVLLTGSYRINGQRLSDIRAYASPVAPGENYTTYRQGSLVGHRLRFTPVVSFFDTVSVTMDLQLANGFVSYDEPALISTGVDGEHELPIDHSRPLGEDGAAFGEHASYADQLKLRKLFANWTTPVGVVRLGRMASHWGLGLLANGGDDETQDWGSPRFGHDHNYGDVVDRLLLATAPFAFFNREPWAKRWLLAVGADLIERDERISRVDGDLGVQCVGALRYAHKGQELGVYVAYRNLEDRYQDTLEVVAYDLFAKGAWEVFDGVELNAAGEMAWVLGKTTWGRNNAFPAEELDVQQLGYVARVGGTYKPIGVGLDFELGYASGDSNPNDQYQRGFSFDPNYNPSLILFEELRAAETLATVANASNPERVGQPPEAVRHIPTNGSATNTIYIRPTVRYAWEGLAARVALLYARAEEDVVDPYGANADTGGTAINYQGRVCKTGGPCARELGMELDVGIDYTYRLDDWVEATVGLQGGRLWPGKAFRDSAGEVPDPIDLIFGRLIVTWLPAPEESVSN